MSSKHHLPFKIISYLTFFFFLFILIITSARSAQAAGDGIGDYLKIYCNRRSGSQLNLETWYGGRCGGTIEESIGFGDIILLDIAEKIGGSVPEESVFQQIEEKLRLWKMLGKNPIEQSILLSQEFSKINSNSAIHNTGLIISYLYQSPPASSIDYLASVSNRLHNNNLINSAYAADPGYGYQALSAVLPIWRIFRNMAYLIFALGFIIYGFMIMFQIKLSAQTVVSIETALPKLIITLVLISFSYAIAGFLIDIFYLILGFIFSVFMDGGVLKESGYGLLTGQTAGLGGSMILFMVNLTFSINKIISGLLSVPLALGSVITFVFTLAGGLSLILTLVLLIAVLITFIKIAWMLIQSYVKILLNIIFSPLLLLGNIMPGSNAFSGWVKGIFAELSVFASTIILIILSFYFFGGHLAFGVGNPPTAEAALWVPAPLFGKGLGNIVQDLSIPSWAQEILWSEADLNLSRYALIGLGILFIIPKTADAIRQALKTQGFAFESAIGEALKGGWSPIGKPIGYVRNAATKPVNEGVSNWVSSRLPTSMKRKGPEDFSI